MRNLKQNIKLVGSATLIAIAILILSISYDDIDFITTFILVTTSIVLLVLGIKFLLEYNKARFYYEEEEIDDMDDAKMLNIMEEIEEMYHLYPTYHPRIRALYERLGERVMELYNDENN